MFIFNGVGRFYFESNRHSKRSYFLGVVPKSSWLYLRHRETIPFVSQPITSLAFFRTVKITTTAASVIRLVTAS